MRMRGIPSARGRGQGMGTALTRGNRLAVVRELRRSQQVNLVERHRIASKHSVDKREVWWETGESKRKGGKVGGKVGLGQQKHVILQEQNRMM